MKLILYYIITRHQKLIAYVQQTGSKIYFKGNYHELGLNYRIEFIVIINQFITNFIINAAVERCP